MKVYKKVYIEGFLEYSHMRNKFCIAHGKKYLFIETTSEISDLRETLVPHINIFKKVCFYFEFCFIEKTPTSNADYKISNGSSDVRFCLAEEDYMS